jgi:hypothetical protein
MRCSLALLFAMACGTPPKPAEPPPTTVAATASCPASFAEAQGACPPSATSCRYPEGTCNCMPAPWCSGVAPPPHYRQQTSWVCPDKLRPDGCPISRPTESSGCTREGQRCDYTCSCVDVATCTKGAWAIETGDCKP